ncbi:hypothetical protein BN946_scf184943.g45 [Trametes cinnabarina]|uniref:Oxidase ustYa n=1 Tax=Pycnoporus cinnabarinus TaxID=5643 RepID=A0A060SCB8_PYCCI|nr:hypothetical protein BN946_scf184943.g45 [Trametes cinnabarina]
MKDDLPYQPARRGWGPYVLLCASLLGLAISLLPFAARKTLLPPLESPSSKPLSEYTYVGEDYPDYYPVELGEVSLTPENTIHYQIFSEESEREWLSVYPPGGGFLRLGEEGRPFGLALFHQMHCLMRIRRAMETRTSSDHVHHCFNYLRQTIMCEANPTVEPVIPILGRRSVNAEIPRVCKDWTQVYALAQENWQANGLQARDLDTMYEYD